MIPGARPQAIAEFLEARIAEDEARAFDADAWAAESGPARWIGGSGDGLVFRLGLGGAHIASWSPARTLAECAAKRAIIELAEGVETMDYQIRNEWGGDLEGTGDDILKALAAIYADHPDYRQEWADGTR